MKSWKHNEKSKEKMSIARKGVKKSEETKAKMKIAQQARQERTRKALELLEQQQKANQKIVGVISDDEFAYYKDLND